MSASDSGIADKNGLRDAFEIAGGGAPIAIDDGATKVLGFMLKQGECDVWIRSPSIEIRYSWLERSKPSPYFGRLAPLVLSELMQLGGIQTVDGEKEFPIRSGTCGSGRYGFSYSKKWVLIKLETDQILIRVRSRKTRLKVPLPIFGNQPKKLR